VQKAQDDKENRMKLQGIRSVVAAGVLLVVLLSAGGAAAQSGGPEGEGAEPAAGAEAQALLGPGFTYQGRLRSDGAPVNGVCDFEFGLWDTAAGGTQLGATQPVPFVNVTDGAFTVALNGGNTFGFDAFSGDARYLEIAVRCPAGAGDYTILAPRRALTAVPYALGLRPGALISTSSGGTAFEVVHTGTSRAASFTNHSTSNTAAVRVDNLGNSYGVYAVSTDGIGVLGLHDAASGTAPGVEGTTNSTASNAVGVLGQVSPTSVGGHSAGVRGINNGTSSSGIGVYGSQAGGGWGVYGTTPSGRGVYGASTSGAGVYGSATGAGAYGGYFANPSATTGAALYASGDVKQSLTGNGLVKAAVYVECEDTSPEVFQYFNNVNGAAITISGGSEPGECIVDFGFDISDRFVLVTAEYSVDARFAAFSSNAGGTNSLRFSRFGADGVSYSGYLMILVY
jgi:hypothetical protein